MILTSTGHTGQLRLIPESDLAKRVREYAKASHDVSPEKLEKLQVQYENSVRRLVAGSFDRPTRSHENTRAFPRRRIAG